MTCLPYWFPFKSINWLTLLVGYTQTGRWSHKTTFSFRKEIRLTVSRGECPHYQARKWFQLLNVLLRSARVNRGRGWRKPLKCQQRFRFVRAAYSEATNRIAQQPPKQLQQHSSPETGLVSWFWGFKTFWPYNVATHQDREEVHAFLFYRSAHCQQSFFYTLKTSKHCSCCSCRWGGLCLWTAATDVHIVYSPGDTCIWRATGSSYWQVKAQKS